MKTKVCPKHGELSVSEFYTNPARHDGLASHCKECMREWKRTSAGRKSQEKWRHSKKGKKAYRKYSKTEKAANAVRRYAKTVRGQLTHRFNAIQKRCCNPNSMAYRYYGERGIKCKFTKESFITYILACWPLDSYKGYELHRIDNDGNYEPGNVVMLTIAEHNRRHTKEYDDDIPF